MWLRTLIEDYGYWAILVGTFLEGETILILGGFVAQMGYLQLPGVMAAAFVGSFSGDQLYFYIGRRFGPGLIARRLSWQAYADKVYSLIARHENFLLLTFRFYYGLRNVTPFALGASNIDRRKFIVLNAVGAAIWAVTVSLGGYAFGEAFQAMVDQAARFEIYAFGGLIGMGLIIWIVSLIRRRRRARQKLGVTEISKLPP